MSRLEKIFNYLQCTEEQRVRFATFMFGGTAETWWQRERTTLPDGGQGLTWEEFLNILYRKYIPVGERDRRAAEFNSLIQVRQTVADYEAQFHSLSQFAPWIHDQPAEKARWFMHGLRPSIRGRLLALNLTDFSDIFHRASIVDQNEEEQARYRERKREADQKKGGQGRQQRPRRDQSGTPLVLHVGGGIQESV